MCIISCDAIVATLDTVMLVSIAALALYTGPRDVHIAKVILVVDVNVFSNVRPVSNVTIANCQGV